MIDPNLIVFRHHEHEDPNDPRFGQVDVVGTLVFQAVATVGRHEATAPTFGLVHDAIRRQLWQEAYGSLYRDLKELRTAVMIDLASPILNADKINQAFMDMLDRLVFKG